MTMSEELVNPSTGEVVRYHAGPLLPTRQSPAELAQQSAELRDMMRSVLVEGTDYGTIPGVNRPSLFKSGAEWLLKWAGYGHRLEPVDIERDTDGRKFGITYRCTVHLLADPSCIVSSCDGYAGYDEDRFYQSVVALEVKERAFAEKDHRQPKAWKWAEEYRAPWNSVIKMSQKRGFTGATLTACAASGLFTQDMEDVVPPPPPVAKTEMASDADVSAITERIAALPDATKVALREAWKAVPLPVPTTEYLTAEMLPEAFKLLDSFEKSPAAQGYAPGEEPFDSPQASTDAKEQVSQEEQPADLMQEIIEQVKAMTPEVVRAGLLTRQLEIHDDPRRQRMALTSAIYVDRGGSSLGAERIAELAEATDEELETALDHLSEDQRTQLAAALAATDAPETAGEAAASPQEPSEPAAATDTPSLLDAAPTLVERIAAQVEKMAGGKVTAELVRRALEVDGDLPARRDRLIAAMYDEQIEAGAS